MTPAERALLIELASATRALMYGIWKSDREYWVPRINRRLDDLIAENRDSGSKGRLPDVEIPQ